MEQSTHPLQVKSGDKETTGSYQVERYTKKEATRKGFKAFLATFLGAIASIVLPGVHFVSVPLGILASPFVGIYFYMTRKGAAKSMSGNFVCPECHCDNRVASPSICAFYQCKCIQCQHELRLVPA